MVNSMVLFGRKNFISSFDLMNIRLNRMVYILFVVRCVRLGLSRFES